MLSPTQVAERIDLGQSEDFLLETVQRHLLLDPNNTNYQLQLAHLYEICRNDLTRAKEIYLKLSPNNKVAQYRLMLINLYNIPQCHLPLQKIKLIPNYNADNREVHLLLFQAIYIDTTLAVSKIIAKYRASKSFIEFILLQDEKNNYINFFLAYFYSFTNKNMAIPWIKKCYVASSHIQREIARIFIRVFKNKDRALQYYIMAAQGGDKASFDLLIQLVDKFDNLYPKLINIKQSTQEQKDELFKKKPKVLKRVYSQIDKDDCNICCSSYIGSEKITTILVCGHAFHLDCLQQLKEKKCPTCRSCFII
jgi:hypothetical protein